MRELVGLVQFLDLERQGQDRFFSIHTRYAKETTEECV